MSAGADKDTRLSSNMEDYLEAVAVLKEQKGTVRVKDISLLMDVKKPSVTGALKVLAEKGLVVHERYGHVHLSEKGQRIAERVKRKHDVLVDFLGGILGVSGKTAEEDACRIEHAISPATFDKLFKFIKENGTLLSEKA